MRFLFAILGKIKSKVSEISLYGNDISQGYNKKRKLFRNNSFVLAHSTAKKICNKQPTLKSSIQ